MLKNLNNKINNSKGFSLVELIVVIAIMVILIALLVPNVVGYISKAQDTSNYATAKSVYNAVNSTVINYKAQEGVYPTAKQLATELKTMAASKSESFVLVPKGTGVSIGYDGNGYVWAVAVAQETTATTAVAATSKHIQIYSPVMSGNVYMSGTADASHLGSTQIPKDITCDCRGENAWYGRETSADVPELLK